jgi:methionyl-tRNA formyltransferase
MIPGKIIDKFNQGMLVVHPSLLPKYRGSCPIQHAILNREKETGVSIIEISKNKFDAGSILY